MKLIKTKDERQRDAAVREWVQQLHQFEMLPDEQLAAEFVEFYHRQSELAGRDHALLTHVACRLKDPGFSRIRRWQRRAAVRMPGVLRAWRRICGG